MGNWVSLLHNRLLAHQPYSQHHFGRRMAERALLSPQTVSVEVRCQAIGPSVVRGAEMGVDLMVPPGQRQDAGIPNWLDVSRGKGVRS